MAHGSFTFERLNRLAELEERHFWFEGRRLLVSSLLGRHAGAPRGRHLLDAGCGTGALAETLARSGDRLVALDARREGLARLSRGGAAALLVQGDATQLPLRDETMDVVLMLDVLEHLDDAHSLREAVRALRRDGLVILTVPAMQWLWSYRDEAAGHRRRYSRRRLRALLEEAALDVVDVRYYQCLLFPLVALTRLMGRRGPRWRDREERPGRLNGLLARINRWEVRAGRRVRWPWGSSLAAVARKR